MAHALKLENVRLCPPGKFRLIDGRDSVIGERDHA